MRHPTKARIQIILPTVILLIAGLVSAAILFFPAQSESDGGKSKTGQSASTTGPQSLLTTCPATNQFKCYEEFFANKTRTTTPVAAINDIKKIQDTDAYAKSQCHQLTHVVGRAAFDRYGSIGAAYAKGDSFCWSGYYHGVTERAIGKMGAVKVKQQANSICAELASAKPYSFDHYNCAHGMGHGFLTVDSFKLFDALKTCDLLNDDWERKSCYGGVYMENVMVVARGDGTTEYLKPEKPLYPCTAVEDTYKQQCYLMQTSYILQQNGYNFNEAFRLCRDGPDAANYAETCYQSIGRDASGSTVSDIQRTRDNCDQAPDQTGRKHCMLGAVRDFISFHHNDAEAKKLCAAFGRELQPDCLSETSTYYATFK